MKTLIRESNLSPALILHMKGTIAVILVVDAEGKVECARVTSGHPLAKKTIEERLKGWTFSPVKVEDKPVSYLGLLVLRVEYGSLSLGESVALATVGWQHSRANPASPSANSLIVKTEPNAIVWLDEIRRGVTDLSGKLALPSVSTGRHVLRVRANGFREATMPLLPGKRGLIPVRLVHTSDEAELSFQQAEEAREKAKDDESRQTAVELYRRTLRLRTVFPAAHVGLARVLMERNQYQEALAEIEAARRTRPVYPEASAAEGRIYREMAFADEAVKSFQRALREGRGFQPEAHVGLARVYEDRGQYEEAATEYQTAIKQLSDTEPVIYQLLGAAYERVQKYKEAVAAYEKYLQLAPNGSLAPAVRSILDQVRRQAAGEVLSPN